MNSFLQTVNWIGGLEIFQQSAGASTCIWISWIITFCLVFFVEIAYHPKNMQGKRSNMFDKQYCWRNRVAVYGWIVYVVLLAKFFNIYSLLKWGCEFTQISFLRVGIIIAVLIVWVTIGAIGLLSKYTMLKPRRYTNFMDSIVNVFLDVLFLLIFNSLYLFIDEKITSKIVVQNCIAIMIIILATTAGIKFFQRKRSANALKGI